MSTSTRKNTSFQGPQEYCYWKEYATLSEMQLKQTDEHYNIYIWCILESNNDNVLKK